MDLEKNKFDIQKNKYYFVEEFYMKSRLIKIANSFLCESTEYKTLSLRLSDVSDSQGLFSLKNQNVARMSLPLILKSAGIYRANINALPGEEVQPIT